MFCYLHQCVLNNVFTSYYNDKARVYWVDQHPREKTICIPAIGFFDCCLQNDRNEILTCKLISLTCISHSQTRSNGFNSIFITICQPMPLGINFKKWKIDPHGRCHIALLLRACGDVTNVLKNTVLIQYFSMFHIFLYKIISEKQHTENDI